VCPSASFVRFSVAASSLAMRCWAAIAGLPPVDPRRFGDDVDSVVEQSVEPRT
jgi:hypothetical protein